MYDLFSFRQCQHKYIRFFFSFCIFFNPFISISIRTRQITWGTMSTVLAWIIWSTERERAYSPKEITFLVWESCSKEELWLIPEGPCSSNQCLGICVWDGSFLQEERDREPLRQIPWSPLSPPPPLHLHPSSSIPPPPPSPSLPRSRRGVWRHESFYLRETSKFTPLFSSVVSHEKFNTMHCIKFLIGLCEGCLKTPHTQQIISK